MPCPATLACVPPTPSRSTSQDNVAIVANEGGLPSGTSLAAGLTLLEAIPEAHKVALCAIAPGEPIVRYGVVIGYAESPIAKGSWVHEGVMSLPVAPPLDGLRLATAVPDPLPPLEGYTFEGFLNADGSVGTKNILGIATTVQCVSATVEFAVKRIRSEILPVTPTSTM